MARTRQLPRLTEKTVKGMVYYIVQTWTPDGKRVTVSFGPASHDRSVGNIQVAYGKWLQLYEANPHRVFQFKNPWEAITSVSNTAGIVTIQDLIDQYDRFAAETFKFTGKGEINPHYHRLQITVKLLVPYKDWPVNSFGADELRAVLNALVTYRYAAGKAEKALTRDSINECLTQLRKMFAWAVGRRVMEPAAEQALREVRPIRYGAADVTESKKRKAVTQDEYEKVLVELHGEFGDMMRVMWLCQIRPDEVCSMRPLDFVTDDATCWIYIPGRDRGPLGDHKTAHHGRVHAIPITPRVQAILKPRIDRCADPGDYLFKPERGMEHHQETRFANRKTPINQGNRPGTNRVEHPMIKTLSDRYTPQSFNTGVKRACKRAKVDPFTPYDLRRSSITRARAVLGKEAATTLAGHAAQSTTDIYLLEEVQEAIKAAKELETRENAQSREENKKK